MTPEAVYALARRHIDHESAVVATAIAWAESDLDPQAIGDVSLEDEKWGPSCGLWQIRSLHADTGIGRPRDRDRLLDPVFNAAAMATISKGGTDWTPWSMFKNGRYREYLAGVRTAVDEGEPMDGWMPDAIHTPPLSRSGLDWVAGTAWKLLLHTTESNYRRNQGGRSNYHGHQSYPHFEVSEEAIEQYLPITVGAYALAASTSAYGYGNAAHPVQVEIVWAAANAANMPEKLLRNIARVLTFLRRQTGMVPNLPPQGFPQRISTANWFSVQDWYDFEGLAGHGNVPGNFDRWDPGPLPADRIVAFSDEEMGASPQPQPEEPEVAKIAFPVTIESGEHRRIPVPAIAGGMGWTRAYVTYAAAAPVRITAAKVGPYNERPLNDLASHDAWSGRHYIELGEGDEWVEIELAPTPAGTLELMVEATDAGT